MRRQDHFGGLAGRSGASWRAPEVRRGRRGWGRGDRSVASVGCPGDRDRDRTRQARPPGLFLRRHRHRALAPHARPRGGLGRLADRRLPLRPADHRGPDGLGDVAADRHRAGPARWPAGARPRGAVDPLRRPHRRCSPRSRRSTRRWRRPAMQEIYRAPIQPELVTERLREIRAAGRHRGRRPHPRAPTQTAVEDGRRQPASTDGLPQLLGALRGEGNRQTVTPEALISRQAAPVTSSVDSPHGHLPCRGHHQTPGIQERSDLANPANRSVRRAPEVEHRQTTELADCDGGLGGHPDRVTSGPESRQVEVVASAKAEPKKPPQGRPRVRLREGTMAMSSRRNRPAQASACRVQSRSRSPGQPTEAVGRSLRGPATAAPPAAASAGPHGPGLRARRIDSDGALFPVR